MRGWLAEYLRTRDRGRLAESAAIERLRGGARPHVHAVLSSRRVVAAWRTGHIRAALLSAAGNPSCSYVVIPFTTESASVATEQLSALRSQLSVEAFVPAFYKIRLCGQKSALEVSLFDFELLRRAEALLQKVSA